MALRPIGLLLTFLLCQPASASEVEVLDAEHLRLEGVTYRLAGIDAPEPDQQCLQGSRLYACGAVAVGGLMDLTAGAEVACRTGEAESAGAATDGSVNARCYADGYELSEGMVYTGWALADRASGGRFLDLEADARNRRRGLWRGRFVPPWDWRAGARLPEEAPAD